MSGLTEMADILAGVGKPDRVEISVGDTGRFMEAIEKQVGPLVHDPRLPVGMNTFMGVPIVVDRILPPSVIAIKTNGKITHLINLDAGRTALAQEGEG